MTSRYSEWLAQIGQRDVLVLLITFTAVCLAGLYWLVVRDSRRPGLWMIAFVGVFYASLAAYLFLGL